jgi:hypothetical protein
MSSEDEEICKIHAEEDPCNFTTNGSSSPPRALDNTTTSPTGNNIFADAFGVLLQIQMHLRRKMTQKNITMQSKIVDDTTSNLSDEVRR